MSDNILKNPSQSLEGITEEPTGLTRWQFFGIMAALTGGAAIALYRLDQWRTAREIQESWTGNFLEDRWNRILRQKILDEIVQEIGEKDKNIKVVYSEDVGFTLDYDDLRYNVFSITDPRGMSYSYVLRNKVSKSTKSEIRVYPKAYHQLLKDEFVVYLMDCLSYVKNITPTIEIEGKRIPDWKFRSEDRVNLWIIKSNYDFINMLFNHSHQVSPLIGKFIVESIHHLNSSSGGISNRLQYHGDISEFLSDVEKKTFEYFLEKYSKDYFEVLSEYSKKHNLSPGLFGRAYRNSPKPKGGPSSNST